MLSAPTSLPAGPLAGPSERRPTPEWLARAKSELEATGWAAEIYDADWTLRWVSPELRFVLGADENDDAALGIGEHLLEVYDRELWRQAVNGPSRRRALVTVMPYLLWAASDEAEKLIERLEPALAEIAAKAQPIEPPVLWEVPLDFVQGDLDPIRVQCLTIRLFADGRHVGFARIYGPGMRASVLSLVARGSEDMFERMSRLVTPGRRPVAILFADLEGSTELSRRLPSAVYFQLISKMAREIDNVVIRHDGVVGKHVGDGASAFFLADDHGEPSAAVRAAIVAAREISQAVEKLAAEISEETGIEIEAKVNIGLHWGATIYMGQIVSDGRLEVSALGDEVNEAARLQEAARDGVILASKALVERLSEFDASELGIDLSRTTYEQLGKREGVGRKVRKDAGAIPVTEL